MSDGTDERADYEVDENNCRCEGCDNIMCTCDPIVDKNKDDYCSCGCGNKIGSENFIRLHVESAQEQAQREAMEQEKAEQQASEELYREQIGEGRHPWGCFCVRCDG